MLATGLIRTLFLGLILCLSPMTPCETMLYWPHTRALVAYNGGTSGGHGAIKTLFLERDFVPSASALDVGHGPCHDSFPEPDFVSLAHDKICYIGPIPVPWCSIMVAMAVATALSGLFFLSLILFPILAR